MKKLCVLVVLLSISLSFAVPTWTGGANNQWLNVSNWQNYDIYSQTLPAGAETFNLPAGADHPFQAFSPTISASSFAATRYPVVSSGMSGSYYQIVLGEAENPANPYARMDIQSGGDITSVRLLVSLQFPEGAKGVLNISDGGVLNIRSINGPIYKADGVTEAIYTFVGGDLAGATTGILSLAPYGASAELNMTGGVINFNGKPGKPTFFRIGSADFTAMAEVNMSGSAVINAENVFVGSPSASGSGYVTIADSAVFNADFISIYKGSINLVSPSASVVVTDDTGIFGDLTNEGNENLCYKTAYLNQNKVIANGVNDNNQLLWTVVGNTTTITMSPNVAYGFSPANGEIVDAKAGEPVVLSWNPAASAVSHDVYFGYNQADVANADITNFNIYAGRKTSTSYNANITGMGMNVYYRIDEVASNGTILQKGAVIQFAVSDRLYVDDFENYADTAALVAAWQQAGGASISLNDGGVQTGGDNAMKLSYNNSASPYASTVSIDYGTNPANFLQNDMVKSVQMLVQSTNFQLEGIRTLLGNENLTAFDSWTSVSGQWGKVAGADAGVFTGLPYGSTASFMWTDRDMNGNGLGLANVCEFRSPTFTAIGSKLVLYVNGADSGSIHCYIKKASDGSIIADARPSGAWNTFVRREISLATVQGQSIYIDFIENDTANVAGLGFIAEYSDTEVQPLVAGDFLGGGCGLTSEDQFLMSWGGAPINVWDAAWRRVVADASIFIGGPCGDVPGSLTCFWMSDQGSGIGSVGQTAANSFTVNSDILRFYVRGYTGTGSESSRVYLKLAADDSIIAAITPPNNIGAIRADVDVSSYYGQQVYFICVDNYPGGWFGLDAIEEMNYSDVKMLPLTITLEDDFSNSAVYDISSNKYAVTAQGDGSLIASAPLSFFEDNGVLVEFIKQVSITIGSGTLDTSVPQSGDVYFKSLWLSAEEVGVLALDLLPQEGSVATLYAGVPVSISWTAAPAATAHDVYFGYSYADVIGADNSDVSGIYLGRQSQTSSDVTITSPSTDCYYRIDEVDVDGEVLAKGKVTHFTTSQIVYIDDFEHYIDADALKLVWQEVGGAVLAVDSNDIAGKNMQITYDNTSSPFVSKAQRGYSSVVDLSGNGEIGAINLNFKDGGFASDYIAGECGYQSSEAQQFPGWAQSGDCWHHAISGPGAPHFDQGTACPDAPSIGFMLSDAYSGLGTYTSPDFTLQGQTLRLWVRGHAYKSNPQESGRSTILVKNANDNSIVFDVDMTGMPEYGAAKKEYDISGLNGVSVYVELTDNIPATDSAYYWIGIDQVVMLSYSDMTVPFSLVVTDDSANSASYSITDNYQRRMDLLSDGVMKMAVPLAYFEQAGVDVTAVTDISFVLGDGVNPTGTGDAYVREVILSSNCLSGTVTAITGDMNGDCIVDIDDVKALAKQWISAYDFVDFSDMAASWGDMEL